MHQRDPTLMLSLSFAAVKAAVFRSFPALILQFSTTLCYLC